MTITEHKEFGLAEAVRHVTIAQDALANENRRHEAETARLEREIAATKYRRELVIAGSPLASVLLAEHVIEVVNPENVARGAGREAVAAAIEDLASGAPKLRDRYFGTKVYDRWDGQREDGEYGTGPRHGATIFSVGLTAPYRNKRHGDPKKRKPEEELTAAQIDAAIAYLYALLGTLARP